MEGELKEPTTTYKDQPRAELDHDLRRLYIENSTFRGTGRNPIVLGDGTKVAIRPRQMSDDEDVVTTRDIPDNVKWEFTLHRKDRTDGQGTRYYFGKFDNEEGSVLREVITPPTESADAAVKQATPEATKQIASALEKVSANKRAFVRKQHLELLAASARARPTEPERPPEKRVKIAVDVTGRHHEIMPDGPLYYKKSN